MRRGAGDDTFILGCGAPLGSLVGVVDGMRIGPDVGPLVGPTADRSAARLPGGPAVDPRAPGASTLGRAFLHRRFWLNDPDCLMLRTTETELTPEQARTWALAVGVSRRHGAGVRRPRPARAPTSGRCSTRSWPSGARSTPRPPPGGHPQVPDLLDTPSPPRSAPPAGR